MNRISYETAESENVGAPVGDSVGDGAVGAGVVGSAVGRGVGADVGADGDTDGAGDVGDVTVGDGVAGERVGAAVALVPVVGVPVGDGVAGAIAGAGVVAGPNGGWVGAIDGGLVRASERLVQRNASSVSSKLSAGAPGSAVVLVQPEQLNPPPAV